METSRLTDFDHSMFRLARERTPVRLVDGRTVRLIAWKPKRRGRRRHREARVEFPSSRRCSVKIELIVAVADGQGVMVPLPPRGGEAS